MSEHILNVFVSSPGDVAAERRRIQLVVERLNAEFKDRVRIDTIRWETKFYSAHDTFQQQIPEAADCDIVIAIFRARLGTPLPESFPKPPDSTDPYPSGTAYEILSAIQARKSGKPLPDIYVFRYPQAPSVQLDAADRAAIEQEWKRLQAFFETWFKNTANQFTAAFQNYYSTDDFARQVEECLRQWLERHGYAPQGPVWDRRLGSPFPGLAAFDSDRSAVFFGRNTAIAQALEHLRAAPTPFLLVVGASGSGKSSLLRAGLLPEITAPGGFPEIDFWRSAIVVPGADPFGSLADALLTDNALGRELRSGPFANSHLLAQQLATDPDTALAPIRAALDAAAAQRRLDANFDALRPARLALAIDQAERLFLEAGPTDRERFAKLLEALLAHDLAVVIMALRSDAYAQFQESEALIGLRARGATFDLLPPTPAELEEMVTRPVTACHPPLAFEEREGRSLAASLVADAKGGDALPLLQMTLSRLYAEEEIRADGILRFADYRGMAAAVTETADEALGAVPEAARKTLPALITALVQDVAVDPISKAFVPVVTYLDRRGYEARDPDRKALIDAFVERRLLTSEGDDFIQSVRPVHEALLRIWPRAREIIEENASLIQVRHTLAPIVRAWQEADDATKQNYETLSPALLAGAQQLLDRFGGDVEESTREFTKKAQQRDLERRDREIRNARRLVRRTGAGLVAALILAGLAGWQWHRAAAERTVAQHNLATATHSLTIATQTANGLVWDIAWKFQRLGVPNSLVKDILDQVTKLQDQLMQNGQSSPGLRASQAGALLETSLTLLFLHQTQGALEAARKAQSIFRALAESQPTNKLWQSDLAGSDGMVGVELGAEGNLSAELADYLEAQSIERRLVAQNPGDTGEQASLGDDDSGIGDVLKAQGKLPEALTSYRMAQNIHEKLAIQNPGDLGNDDYKIGDVLKAQGNLPGAFAAYLKAQSLYGMLINMSPSDAVDQGTWGEIYERVGEVLKAQGNFAGALSAFRKARAIQKKLTEKDPNNVWWQSDLAWSDSDIGAVLKAQGDLALALLAYRSAQVINKKVTEQDPADAMLRDALARNDFRIGDVLRAQADIAAAVSAERDALAILKPLTEHDPTNAEWRDNLAEAETSLGQALQARGDLAAAVSAERSALAILKSLTEHDPTNAEWRNDLGEADTSFGESLQAQGKLGDALTVYRDAQTVFERLIELDKTNSEWRKRLTTVDLDIDSALKRQGNQTTS